MKAGFAEADLMAALEAKTEFYAALIGGCQNTFIERMLRPLHDRITLLRITSMSQPKRIDKSLREVTAIWRAVQNGDPDLAEQCCVDYVKAAAVAPLSMIERSSATRETAATDRVASPCADRDFSRSRVMDGKLP
jgi:DNA-binding GntR family transcriptional regulator